MSKKPANQLYIEQSDIKNKNIEELLRKTIGRKRTGVIRLQYINGYVDYPRDLNCVASIVSYKFYSEMENLEHMVDDRPTVEELMGTDLPWKGLVKFKDETLDERYRIEGIVRPLIDQDGFMFMLRDIKDTPPYSDGLSIFDITRDFKKSTVSVNARTGLKQMEVVTLFQGYNKSLETLQETLIALGYIRNEKDQFEMHHEDKSISTIDITLIGVSVIVDK